LRRADGPSFDQAMKDRDSELYKLITGLGKQAEEVNDDDKANQETDTFPENGDSAGPEDEERKVEIDDAQSGIPLTNRRASVATMRRASML
jgi:hypothetical protein